MHPLKHLNTLYLHRYRIRFCALERGFLPRSLFFTLRGAWGHAIHQTTPTLTDLLFKNNAKAKTQHLVKGNDPPRAYILMPEKHEQRNFPGTELTFILTLIGNADRYFQKLIPTFEQMAANGLGEDRLPFVFTGYERIPNLFSTSADKFCWRFDEVDYPHSNRLVFQTKTFCCINQTRTENEKHAKPIDSLTLPIIAESLYRRAIILNTTYCGSKEKSAEKLPNELTNGRVVLSNLMSETTKGAEETFSLSGISGSLTLTHINEDLLPLLAFGQYMHIGNNTAYGLGNYRIYEPDKNKQYNLRHAPKRMGNNSEK